MTQYLRKKTQRNNSKAPVSHLQHAPSPDAIETCVIDCDLIFFTSFNEWTHQ